ncbi:MAG: hypothetical protein CVV42_19465 [Candidatus Riflebacteria bacterium HGW-Riflebacteria-2]|nr:MAG: hypothetical protein CVV42_19465 [Candidatus Riflebacteria bacterium HGW-Riflebacteria-2]
MKNLFKVFIMLTFAVALIATGCGGGGGGSGAYVPPPSETGSISGQIVNNSISIGGGSVRADAAGTEEVTVYLEQNPEITTSADSAGKFLLENIPPGVVNLIAEHKTKDGQLFRMRSDDVTVEAAKTTELPATITVTKADKQISGRIINANTSAAIEGVTVSAWGKTITTDGNGGFILANLPDLAFQFKLVKDGFETKLVSVETGSDLAQSFLVELVPATAVLPGATTGTIKGKIVFNGMPMQGSTVVCEQYLNFKTETDADGIFELQGIPAGKVNLVAVFTMDPNDPDALRARSSEQTLSAGQTLDMTGTPLTLDWMMGSVSGWVTISGGGEPLTDVKVTVLEKQTTSSSDNSKLGFYTIGRLPSQNVTVVFEKSGYVTQTFTGDTSSGWNLNVAMVPIILEDIVPEVVDEGDLRDVNSIAKDMYKMQLDENNILLTVQAIVRLPEITGLRRSQLYMFSNDGGPGMFETQVEKDGFINTRAVTASSSAALIMLGIKDERYLYTYHPMLLKVWHPQDTEYDNYIDSRSTAEALVLFDKVLWTLDKEKFLIALNKVRKHSDLADLITAVELALRVPEPETLYSDTLMQKSAAIAKKVAEELAVGPYSSSSLRSARVMPSIRGAVGDVSDKAVYVEDDGARSASTVLLTNRSYCHYSVTITNDMTYDVIKSPAGNNYFTLERSTHTSYSWSWPPDRKLQVTTDLGPGEFTTKFTKQKGLSVFDGLMTLAGTVIGAGASSYEELSDGYKMLATTGQGVLEIINKATTANINSSEDALKLADELLFSAGKMGFEVLMDFAPKYFGAKLARELKSSWFKTAAKFMAKKALIWGVAIYNTTDVALIIYDVAKTPDYYEEKGWQTKGGWYGDLFAEKIGKMKYMRVIFNMPMNGTAHYRQIANDGTVTESSVDTNDGPVEHIAPYVPIDGAVVSINPDPDTRALIGASYEFENSRGKVGVLFSNVGFNGFIDRYNDRAFDETKMQFVWGNPGPAFMQITEISSKDVYPALMSFDYFDHWVYSSVEWASVLPGYPYYAGIILSENP